MAEKRIRILFILEHFHPYVGGAETLFLSLTKQLVLRGFEVVVLTTRHDSDLKAHERYEGITIHRINCLNRFMFTIAALPKAIQLAKSCDLIHTSSYTAAVPSFLASVIRRRKLTITFHEYWSKLWFQLPYLNLIQRIAYYLFEQLIVSFSYHRIIAVSNYTLERIKKRKPRAAVTRIYNGIDYSDWELEWTPPKDRFKVLFLGRLGVSKGLNVLLETADEFLDRSESFNITMILPNYPEKLSRRIHRKLASLKNGEQVTVIQSLPFEALKREMIGSSCVLIPSYSEGFGYVGVEAGAMNIPIVSSQKGALKETISGVHIEMESLDKTSLLNALIQASEGKWKEKEKKIFKLERTIDHYCDLFTKLTKG